MNRTAPIAAVVLLVACGREPAPTAPPPPRPTEEPPVAATTDLTIEQRWGGVLRVEEGAGAGIEALLVRDDAAYDALIARIPTERVQMKQPAPPSEDPLLARPPIDFSTHMLVVVARTDTLERPDLLQITVDGARLVVTHDSPAPPPAARPHGIGGYLAAKVRRHDGDLVLATPRLITDAAELAGATGTLITIRGELTRTKIPTLLGVDVEEGTATAGATAEATGWLETTQVTQAELDAEIAEHGQFAHRGPGTFHHLVAPDRNGLAAARPVY